MGIDRGLMTLLQGVAQRSAYWAEVKRNGSRLTTWKFKPNIQVYNNPSIKCCFCQEFVPTNRIWIVDRKEMRVISVWKSGRRQVLGGAHPHISGGGQICMGNAEDPTEALFMGLNPNSAYHGVKNWLDGSLGHCCWEGSNRDRDDEDDERVRCENCERLMDSDEAVWADDDPYCSNCYHARFFFCDGCSEDIRVSNDEGLTDPNSGERVCTECWNEEFFTCAGCDEEKSRRTELGETRDGQNFCNECLVGEDE